MFKEGQKKKWTLENLKIAIESKKIYFNETISFANKDKFWLDANDNSEWRSFISDLLPQLCTYHIKLDLSHNLLKDHHACKLAEGLLKCTSGSLELNLSHNKFTRSTLLTFANILRRCSIQITINCTKAFLVNPVVLFNFIKKSLAETYNLPKNHLLVLQAANDPNSLFSQGGFFPRDISRYISHLTYLNISKNSLFKNFSKSIPVANLPVNEEHFLRSLEQKILLKWPDVFDCKVSLPCADKLQIRFDEKNWDGIKKILIYLKEIDFYNPDFDSFSGARFDGDSLKTLNIFGVHSIEFFAVYICGLDPEIGAFKKKFEFEQELKSKERSFNLS